MLYCGSVNRYLDICANNWSDEFNYILCNAPAPPPHTHILWCGLRFRSGQTWVDPAVPAVGGKTSRRGAKACQESYEILKKNWFGPRNFHM